MFHLDFFVEVKMKHQTYQLFRQAHLGNIDREALLEAKKNERDPFYANLIDLLLENKTFYVSWDIQSFTSKFREAPPRERMDETVFAFLLRLTRLVKEEAYIRTFRKPESHDALLAWVHFLRLTIQCTLALLYKVQWNTPKTIGYLEEAILKMMYTGESSALRTLMKQLGIQLSRPEQPYAAELIFNQINFLQPMQWSGFTWRYLHWMAEAERLDDRPYWKKTFREILEGPFYRTLRCPICSNHFHDMVQRYKDEILNDGDLRMILFEMHNQVHAERRKLMPSLKEPDYSESELQEDIDFMLKGLEVQ